MRRALTAGLILAALGCSQPPAVPLTDVGPVGSFVLTERDGRTVRPSDLGGKVWVASFIFTRCMGPCPQVTGSVRKLQDAFADRPDVLFVTFTVDPDHDREKELRDYADKFGADPNRWLFLTGPRDEVYRVIRDSFHLGVQQTEGDERKPGSEVAHSTRLAVVDRRGHVRGYFDGRQVDDEGKSVDDTPRVRAAVQTLLREDDRLADGWTLRQGLPPLNACLNAASAVLVLLGYAAIRNRYVRLHKALMLSALSVSTAFLASYLFLHFFVIRGEHTPFRERVPLAPDGVAKAYSAILVSHIVLAIVAAPLVLVTAYFGVRDRLARHVRLARWALPIWLYVSVTGVVVYWMLYRLYPTP